MEMINLKLTDEILYKKVSIAAEELIQELHAEYSTQNYINQNFLFSDSFENKMNKLIKKNTDSRILLKQISKKIASIALILLTGTLTLTLSVDACRKQVFHAITSIFDGYTSTSYKVDDPILAETQNFYYPTYIPENYSLIKENTNKISAYRSYKDNLEGTFTFLATRISEHIVICRDSEYQTFEEIEIHGIKGELRIKDDFYTTLIFANDYIEYTLSSNSLSKKELIKIAESISLEQ